MAWLGLPARAAHADSPSDAHASSVVFTVRRDAAASSCPDALTLAEDVLRLTTKVRLDPDATATGDRIDVDFKHGPAGFRAQVHATGERSGQRVLTHKGATCGPLAEAVAVSLAILLDPEWHPPVPAEPPPPEPPPAPAPPVTEAPPPRAPAPTTGGDWAVRAAVTTGAALGIVRAAAPIFGVLLAADPVPELSFGVGAILVPGQSLPLAPGHVDVSLVGAEVAACALPLGSARLRLGVCATAALGSVAAKGSGYFRDGSTQRPWLAFGGHAQALGQIAGPLGWTLRAGALAPTTTEAFSIDGAGVAYAPPRVAVVLAAGATMTFR